MLPPELLVVALHHLTHPARVADHVVLFVRLDRAQGGRAGQGVTVVGQPAVKDVLLEVVRDFGAYPDRSKRDVAAVRPFRLGVVAGAAFPWLGGNQLAGWPKPGRDL